MHAFFEKFPSAVVLLLFIMPISSHAENATVICSKFDYFNAQSLQSFKDTELISDWVSGQSMPSSLNRLVIALPKSHAHEKFDCVDKAEHIADGVKQTISNGVARVGHPPARAERIVVGKYSDTTIFGPIINDKKLRANRSFGC